MATKAPSVVTMKIIAATLADKHDLSKKQANELCGAFVDSLMRHLKRGDKIRIPGFGTFQVAKRAARMGVNPATGEKIKIKASKKVRFRPAKELKESV